MKDLFKTIIDNIVIVGTIIASIVATVSAMKWIIKIIRREPPNPDYERKKTLALEQCDLFQKRIIPKYLGIKEYARINKMKISKIVQFIDTNTIRKPLTPHPKTNIFLDMVMDLFNDMDSFAAYFVVNDIADESLAYKAQGKAFCDIINELNNIFRLFISIKKEDYNNLTELYNIWSIRI